MYTPVTTDIAGAVKVLREGRIVAFPTGTSYGLAADALQGFALQRLRNMKGRPKGKTFTIFVREQLRDRYFKVSDVERRLFERMQGQPLTLLLVPNEPLAHLAKDGRVGLRVIDHPMMQALADAINVPLTATSANVSGQEPCYSPDEILKQFPGKIDPTSRIYGDIQAAGDTTYDLSLGCILDGGVLPKRQPTTVAKIVGSRIVIVRRGTVTTQDLKISSL